MNEKHIKMYKAFLEQKYFNADEGEELKIFEELITFEPILACCGFEFHREIQKYFNMKENYLFENYSGKDLIRILNLKKEKEALFYFVYLNDGSNARIAIELGNMSIAKITRNSEEYNNSKHYKVIKEQYELILKEWNEIKEYTLNRFKQAK